MLNSNWLKKSSGQALSESLAVFPVLVSILLLGGSLYKLLDADLAASKAARLATWHSTLYVAGPTSKVDIQHKIQDYIIVGQRWMDFGHDNNGPDSIVNPTVYATGGHAAIGVDEATPISPIQNYPSSYSSKLGVMAGIDKVDIEPIRVSIPIDDKSSIFRSFGSSSYMLSSRRGSEDGKYFDVPEDDITKTPRFNVRGKGAIIASAYTPMGEQTFSDNVENVAADGHPLKVFEFMRGTLSGLGLREMDQLLTDEGMTTVPTNQSRILPPELGTFSPLP